MQKLKKVFTPGGSQDDEVMYGTPEPASAHKEPFLEGKTNLAANDKEAIAAAHERQSSLGQPSDTLGQQSQASGSEYSRDAAGNEGMSGSTSEGGKKEHGVLRQILNPGGNKYDETAYGPPSTTDPAAQGTPASAIAGTTTSDLRPVLSSDAASTTALKSGIPGPYAEGADEASTGTGATSSGVPEVPAKSSERYLGDSGAPSTGGDFGRDTSAALGLGAGTGAMSSGIGHHATTGDPDVERATYTDRAYQLGSGGATHGHSHQFAGATTDLPTEGVVHATQGPHSTDIANKLDPHVPGEYPSSDGMDKHAQGSGLGTGAALGGVGAGAAGVGAYGASRDMDPAMTTGATSRYGMQEDPALSREAQPTSTGYPSTQSGDPAHHYGRDAALAGGAGAAGAGAYAAYDNRRDDTGPASKTIGPHDSNVANVLDPRVQPEPEKMKTSSEPEKPAEKDHHYGRDAAIVGGAGAAGYGAKELYDDKHEKKLQKAREEEAAKKSTDSGERKPSLVHRILHSGEKDKTKSVDEGKPSGLDYKERDEANHRRHQEELAAAGGAGAVGAGAYEAEKHGPNKLHKDPPTSRHMGTDGPIGDDHKVSGLPSGHSGSTGGAEDGIVIEPHTGLPMNIGKYGDGHGGTDGGKQIEGYHETGERRGSSIGTAEGADKKHGHHPGEDGAVGPDWEKIRKANTPY